MIWLIGNKGMLGTEIARQLTENKLDFVGTDRDVDFTDMPDDPDYQASLWALAEREGKEALHKLLKEADPESAEAIPAGNEKRVIRALEYFHLTGEKFSIHNERERVKENAYNTAYFVLTDDREVMYDRINRRVDLMMEAGLLAEVRGLYEHVVPADATSMQALGYKERLPSAFKFLCFP